MGTLEVFFIITAVISGALLIWSFTDSFKKYF